MLEEQNPYAPSVPRKTYPSPPGQFKRAVVSLLHDHFLFFFLLFGIATVLLATRFFLAYLPVAQRLVISAVATCHGVPDADGRRL